MTEQFSEPPLPLNPGEVAAAEPAPAAPAASRRPSAVANVMANWGGQLAVIISGFLVPRLVFDHVGQAQLGVWDLGWSATSYLSLLTGGMASSVNRYVARHHATGDQAGMNRSVSSTACFFAAAAVVAAAISVTVYFLLPTLLPKSFLGLEPLAQQVWLCLSLGFVVGLFGLVYNGVLTGHQRYDIVMYIEASGTILAVVAALILLSLGYGVAALALCMLVAAVLDLAAKWLLARRIAPGLRLSPRLVTRASLRDVLGFGAKTYMIQIARIGVYQGNSLLVGMFLGPAAVPLLARSMNLVVQADRVLFHFARVLTPMASSAQAREDHAELARIALNGSRFSLLLSLPIVAALVVFAGPVMEIWMGATFAQLPLLPILAALHLVALAQSGPMYILMGLNRHGLVSVVGVVTAGLSLAASAVLLGVFHTGLIGVALSIGTAVTVANLVIAPLLVRALGLSLREFLLETVPKSLAAVAPFVAWIVACRFLLVGHNVTMLAAGLGGGALVLLLTYWFWAVPVEMKAGIVRKIPFLKARG